jgi:hypothetical protein
VRPLILLAAVAILGLAVPAAAQPWGPPPGAPPGYYPPPYPPPHYRPHPRPRRVCWVEQRWVWVRDAWGRPFQQLVPREVCAWR